jgi:hypothetical protein
VTGKLRRLHIEEICALYSSPSIIRVTKPRRPRWAGNGARMGKRSGACWDLVGEPEGGRQLGDPSVARRTVLKWIFQKWNGGHELD